MKVHVYWNLNRDTYSVRAAEGPNKGKVIGYSDAVDLAHVTFKVQAGGRETVRRKHCKLVHAWLAGELLEGGDVQPVPVTYNPYLHETFVRRADQSPIAAAARASLRKREGKAWVCVNE